MPYTEEGSTDTHTVQLRQENDYTVEQISTKGTLMKISISTG